MDKLFPPRLRNSDPRLTSTFPMEKSAGEITRKVEVSHEYEQAARAAFVGSMTVGDEKFGDLVVVRDDLAKTAEDWNTFCRDNKLSQFKDKPLSVGVQEKVDRTKTRYLYTTDMLPWNYDRSKFAWYSGLERYRFQIEFGAKLMQKAKGSPDRARELANSIIKIKGGWCSSLEVNYSLSNAILEADPMAMVLLLDKPGMGVSNLLNPKSTVFDIFKKTAAYAQMATEVSLRLFGLSDWQSKRIIKKPPTTSYIYHSWSATEALTHEGLNDPNSKYVIVAPVFGHKGFRPELASSGLTLANELAARLEGKPIVGSMVPPVGDILIKYFAGNLSKEQFESYSTSIAATDKIHLRDSLAYLYGLTIDNLALGVKFDPRRHLILIFNNDKFVNPEGMISQMQDSENMGQRVVSQCVTQMDGEHHEHLAGGEATKKIVNFVTGK